MEGVGDIIYAERFSKTNCQSVIFSENTPLTTGYKVQNRNRRFFKSAGKWSKKIWTTFLGTAGDAHGLEILPNNNWKGKKEE